MRRPAEAGISKMRKTVLLILILIFIPAAIADQNDELFASLAAGQRVKFTLKTHTAVTGEICEIKKDSVTIDNSLEQGFKSKITIIKKNISAIEILSRLTPEQKKAITERQKKDFREKIESLAENGKKELAENNYSRAKDLFNEILILDPENAQAKSSLAQAYFMIGKNRFDEFNAAKTSDKLPGIITCAKEALRYDPSIDAYHALLGIAYYENGDYYDASETLSNAYKLNSANTQTLSFLASSLYWLDELADAEKYANEALTLKPDYPFIQKLLATIQKEKAIEETYREISTRLFTVKFKGENAVDTSIATEIVTMLEEDYNDLSPKFNIRFSSPVKVIIYPDAEYYSQTGTAGFYAAHYEPGKQKIHVPVKNFTVNRKVFENALKHELTHSFIHNAAPSVPRWLDEGIAQYYTEENDKELLDTVKYAMALTAKSQSFVHIKDLMDFWEKAKDSRELAEQFYIEALSFTQFLAVDFHDTNLVTLLKNLETAENIDDAFYSTYRIRLDELEKQWIDSLPK